MEDNFQKGKKIINKEKALTNLKDLTRILDKHNIFYCLIFGTLLGAMRESDFIDYDNDIDLAAFWKDRELILKVIKEELPTFSKQDIPYLYDINLIRNNEKIELWLFEDLEDCYVYDPARQPGLRYKKEYFDKAINYEFKGITVKIPYKPANFLTLTYGNTWVTPNAKGSYILGKE